MSMVLNRIKLQYTVWQVDTDCSSKLFEALAQGINTLF